MSGIFSRWQPRYAEHGIPTFPVRSDKKPFVKHWDKLGRKASAQLAEKFQSADALGFALKLDRTEALVFCQWGHKTRAFIRHRGAPRGAATATICASGSRFFAL